MNAEQLNGILSRLSEGHRGQGTVKKMAAVRSSLEAIANEPGNAAHQTQFRDQLNTFVSALRADSINVFSVREESIINDLNLRDLVGRDLEHRSLAAIAGQDLTPRVAADAFNKIHDALQNRLNKIGGLSSGLTELGIDQGAPDAGTVELGLFVPRPETDLSLASLLEEGEELNRLVSAAYEVVEGKPESPPVRYLTSSDYGFLLEVAPQVVAFLVLAVERSLALYKGWLETQLLHQQLKERGAPEALITPLQADSIKQRDEAIHAAVLTAVRERSPSSDDGRKNELTNQVVAEVKLFLSKAERGNYLDIRVGPPAPVPDGAEAPVDGSVSRADSQLLQEIEAMARRLHALEKRGENAKIAAPDPTGS